MAHRQHTSGLRAACVALALATVAAACSGGDESASDTTTAASASSPASTTRPSSSASPTTDDAGANTTNLVADATSTTDATTSTPTTEAAAATTEAAPTTTVPVPVYPLTGVANPDPTIAARKVLVVKIGNEPAARPQSGFNAADIVIEEIVNDNLTRFAFVFHSGESDPVGPIRSGRLQDVDLFGSFSAPLFSWSGGNVPVTRAIDASDLINIGPNHADVYFRSSRERPSNLYSNTTALRTYAPFGAPAPPQQFLYRDPAATPQGVPSLGVEVTLDSIDVDWLWNPEEGLYFRSMEGRPHNDADTGQVTTNNVLVLEMQYLRGISYSPDAQSVGSGEAFIFTGGHFIHGYWERFDRTQPFQLYTDDNVPILLSPGRTFIELPRDDRTTPLGTL